MKLPTIKLSTDFSIDIFKNDLSNQFNVINQETKRYIKEFENKDFFHVPFVKKETIWGSELIFIPFSNKLFKIIETNLCETSFQLHPIKNETWFPIKRCMINDGNNELDVSSHQVIKIKAGSPHMMRKDGKAFEIQDNNLFDDEETLRFFDTSNRATQLRKCLNYVLPSLKNNLYIDSFKEIDPVNDIFIFVIDGFIKIKIGNQIKKITNEDLLIYVRKNNYEILEKIGKIVIQNAKYYCEL